jgi:hypothetical protein
MTDRLDIPFNLELLDLTPHKLQSLRPVTSLDSFESGSSNFASNGLFSIEIFGRVGDELRNRRFSYIDIKVSILHPIIFRALGDLKELYHGILAGTEYATFDEQEHDFVRADTITGKTGYQFFISNWKKIMYMDTKSVTREHNISLIKRFANDAMMNKVLVIPAGLRDMEMGSDGRPQEDEVNTLYRRLLAIANTISDASITHNVEVINTTRFNLQKAYNQIYQTFEDMLSGRRKLIQNRWTARRIFNGTRNVITAANTSVPYLGAEGGFHFNNTGIGLYQTLKCILPVTIYLLKSGFLSQVFASADQPAKLINKNTLKAEAVMLKTKYFDKWMTDEGLETIVTSFSQEDVRHRELEIEGYYLGLIYKGPDGTFRLMHSIDELPEGRDAKNVTPLTFCELLYCSTYRNLNRYPLFVTRYPVTGMGSIYPSKIFARTTINVEVRRELNPEWQPMTDDHIAYQFPIRGSAFVNSLIPHSSKLARLAADFDGDTCSANAVYSEEAIQEVDNFLNSARAYLDTSGQLLSSTNVDTVELVLHNLTHVGA